MRTKVKLLYLVAGVAALVFGTVFWASRHQGYVAKVFLQRHQAQALANTNGPAWREKRLDPFVVRYQDQDAGAAAVLTSLPTAVAQVQAAFPELPDHVYLFIFPDRAAAKTGFGYDFPAGFNGAGMGGDMVVMISPAAWSPEERATKPVDKIVTHELTHVVVFNLAGQSVPKWLTEGLAVLVADQITPAAQRELSQRAASGTTYSLQEVDDLFEDAKSLEDVGEGYELAGSVLKFMVDRYSFETVRQVLVEVGSGRTLDQAFTAVIGTDVKGLDKAWNESLTVGGGLP